MKNQKRFDNQNIHSNQNLAKPSESLGNHNDTFIWEKFKEGDEDALVYIYQKYADGLINYGYRFCRNRELLKDAMQELFFNLIKNRKNLSATTNIKFYLFKSFRRKIIEKLNSKSNLNLALENFENEVITELNPESIFIEEQLDQNQKKLLQKALEQLSPVQKEIICLYFFEGFSYDKIAQIFEYKNTRSVRNLVYRAIEKMIEFINGSGHSINSLLILICLNQVFQA